MSERQVSRKDKSQLPVWSKPRVLRSFTEEELKQEMQKGKAIVYGTVTGIAGVRG